MDGIPGWKASGDEELVAEQQRQEPKADKVADLVLCIGVADGLRLAERNMGLSGQMTR